MRTAPFSCHAEAGRLRYDGSRSGDGRCDDVSRGFGCLTEVMLLILWLGGRHLGSTGKTSSTSIGLCAMLATHAPADVREARSFHQPRPFPLALVTGGRHFTCGWQPDAVLGRLLTQRRPSSLPQLLGFLFLGHSTLALSLRLPLLGAPQTAVWNALMVTFGLRMVKPRGVGWFRPWAAPRAKPIGPTLAEEPGAACSSISAHRPPEETAFGTRLGVLEAAPGHHVLDGFGGPVMSSVRR